MHLHTQLIALLKNKGPGLDRAQSVKSLQGKLGFDSQKSYTKNQVWLEVWLVCMSAVHHMCVVPEAARRRRWFPLELFKVRCGDL